MASSISQAWRSWKSAKVVACMAVIALATGIGCATAIFTVANTVLLKPLPYSFPDRWVTLFGASDLSTETDRISAFSLEDLSKYQDRTRSFDVFGWYYLAGDYNLTSPGAPEHLSGSQVTPSLILNAGVSPILGTLFHDSDGPQVALISSGLWNRLGRDPKLVGKPLTIDGKSYTVMGVMPAWFQLPLVSVSSTDPHNDLWIPVPPRTDAGERSMALYVAYARLKPGVTMAQARQDVEQVAAEIRREQGPDSHYTVKLFALKDFVARDIRPILMLFFAAAALLLLVTCANVSGLLVAKAVGRAQETAIRVALGVKRFQLAVQFFLEGCSISVAAAILGLLASIALTRLVVVFAADYIPRADEVSVDGTVLFFAAVLGFITALLPAFAPLWQALRTHPTELLNGGVRASAGSRSRWLSRTLVIGEVALAFLLLTVGGLLVSEVRNLQRQWPGFEPDHLVAFHLNAGAPASNAEFIAYQNKLIATLEAIPGVTGAAFANQLPLEGCCLGTTLVPEGETPRPDFQEAASFMIVSPGYFKTMRIPLHRGRLLTADDNHEDPLPVVINETLARRNWPDRDPVGAYARASGNGSRVQVVGVIGDVLNQGLGQEARPEFYLLDAVAPVSEMHFVVRTPLATASIFPAIRQAMQRVDPSHPIFAIEGMEEIARQSITTQTFASVVIAFFALAALLMAALGIYSLTYYAVRERTVEIGTRMALGAIRSDILRLILVSGWRMAAFGIPLGAAAAIGATWLLMRFIHLHHVTPLPYVWSAVAVGALTTVASAFPAWLATLVTPMAAIRNNAEPL
ncbi:MAG TPA: ADOP family duplicated permease [Candidatus Limnocylindrales bacterium]|nr:ADOP family duplicated permease [Candidatus Limnocylindrales bacterium]